ncbi:unnamed protein product [Citrullus colocynthis]|uniref:Peptidase metallopeptidase domain-containing protein n=1 Tax=Citrullus colocynthis TaxID=252529 RepID=A0ABP0YK24_9ROSI
MLAQRGEGKKGKYRSNDQERKKKVQLQRQTPTAAVIFRSNSTWCVSDTLHRPHATARYVFFPGKPRWTRRMPMVLTYAFFKENLIRNLSLKDARSVFRNASLKWAHVIPAFNGALGVFGAFFFPEIGRLRLDAAETWAVATHENGHLLGLGHRSVRESVMYPSLKPREKKANLEMDDVEGV